MAPRIDDLQLIRAEYANPDRLATRFRPFREYHESPDMDGVLVQLVGEGAVGEGPPRKVLEIGCGEGAFSARMRDELGVEVTAMDQSGAMVVRAANRGLDAVVGDAQQMPFPDCSFDVVVANWMLYHLPDLAQGLEEISRVLRPGGRLVAATMGGGMLEEVWSLVPDDGTTPDLGFSRENGRELLAARFPEVRMVDMTGTAVFPDRQAVAEYMRSTLTRAHLADELPSFRGPLRATTTNVAFVATTSAEGRCAQAA